MNTDDDLARSDLDRRWELVVEHRERLLRIALARVSDPTEAEDVVHEAMLRCVSFADLDEERVSSFLTSLTMRLCVDQHRVRGRELRAGTAAVRREVEAAGPEEAVCDRAEAQWVAQVASSLPARQWQALTLKARGADITEAARAMDLSYKAVESALSRGRALVRVRIAATLSALICFARRGRHLALPMTTATLACLAVVVGSGAGQPAPGAQSSPRGPVTAQADGRPEETGRTAEHAGVQPVRVHPAPRRPAPRPAAPRPETTIEVPVPGHSIGIGTGKTEDTVDKWAERCATSFGVELDENGKIDAGCRKQAGDPGAYPISDLLDDLT